jgi:antitoxin CptB
MSEKTLNRLRYRSWHRGTREMDLLLGSFADAHLNKFTPEQLSQYEDLLKENDPDLYDWITGKMPPPPAHDHVVMKLLRQHKFSDDPQHPLAKT